LFSGVHVSPFRFSDFTNFDGFVKSDLLRWRTIFAENNSEKPPHCHFER